MLNYLSIYDVVQQHTTHISIIKIKIIGYTLLLLHNHRNKIGKSLTWIYKSNINLVKISCIFLGSVSITWFINFVCLDNRTIYTGSQKNMLMCIMPVLR